MTIDGQLTYCTATEENIGKGRCNHIAHINDEETIGEFLDRCNSIATLRNFALENCAILKEHNQMAYQNLKNLFNYGKTEACIVQATATGKSSIMTAIMDDFSDEPCLFISPKDEINGQFQRHNELNRVNLNGNLNCITYQKICQSWLKGNFDKDFGHLKGRVGLICPDEIHHLNLNESKAKRKWREAVDAFIYYVEKDDGKTKIVGATATPGDGTAISYFCGSNTVSNIDLADAVNMDILSMPYVYGIPGEDTVKGNFFRLKSRLDKAKDEGKITDDFYDEMLTQLMKNTKANLDNLAERKNAILLDASKAIIENDNKNGRGTKILVFCNKSEDTERKMKEYHEIFKELYPDKNISSSKIISKKKTKEEEIFFKNFQSETPVNKGEIQILAVMDMYSEGVHAPNLSISIMDRNIADSECLYYQQVGRVMSSNSPTIIDFSENCNKGYVDWNDLGKKCGKSDQINIANTERYSNEISKIELEINNAISPRSYALNREGKIVKISSYLKNKYEWNSTMYLNNVKRRIFEERNEDGSSKWNVDNAASAEPGFRRKKDRVNLKRKRKGN